MNYQHIYHAGNFADVFKHWILSLVLQSMHKKDNAFVYIDTHAGSALYNLSSAKAKMTEEAKAGIAALWESPLNLSDSLKNYLDLVKKFQLYPNELRFYPGSPYIAHSLLRAQDRMLLNELQANEAQLLKHEFRRDSPVSVHSQNAYQWLIATLPPKIARGVVFIDPPYENPNEYEQILKLLISSLKRWRQGIYVIWYPVIKNQKLAVLLRGLKDAGIDKVLNTQLSIHSEDSPIGLNGSGMLIINPPWKLEEQINESIETLWTSLSPNQKGGYRVSSSP